MTANVSSFEQAQLAEAAYVNLTGIAGSTETQPYKARLIAGGFSDSQASAFVDTWEVIHHLPDTGSDFSATVFRNRQTGAYHLAIRGSTSRSDFLEDANIISANGVAVHQLVDLYNYWMALNTPENTNYQAAYVGYGTTVQFGDSATVRAGTPLATGLGKPVGSTINVSGHSLGGHLAMAFTRLFPAVTSQAFAINGLGFKIGGMVVDQFFQALGGAPAFDPNRIQNIYGIAGFEFAAMNGLFLTQPGGWDGIYIESARVGSPIFGGHGAGQMTDSLAVYDLFFRMDTGLASKTPKEAVTLLNPVFEAASAKADTSLESLVRAWQRLLDITPGSLKTDDREDLYVAVKAIRDSIAVFPPSAGRSVVSLVGRSATELASIATSTDAAATRYALKELNPFAVLGVDYTAHSPTGELDLYNPANGMGKLSTEWVRDRANMLSAILEKNTSDREGYAAIRDTRHWRFVDFDRGRTEFGFIANSPTIDRAKPAHGNVNLLHAVFDAEYTKGLATSVVFGRDIAGTDSAGQAASENDALVGGGHADHIYGQGGNDTIFGENGNDLLEGGSGDDKLYGGAGYDLYIVGQGKDTIVDYDNLGLILDGSGKPISGQFVGQAGGTYTFIGNNQITGTLTGTTLTLSLPGGATVVVENFDRAKGTFGIGLATQEQVTVTLDGDRSPVENYASLAPTDPYEAGWRNVRVQSEVRDSEGVVILVNLVYNLVDALGNLICSNAVAAQNDALYGSSSADLIKGYAQNDVLSGKEGSDTIEGGDDADQLFGDADDDVLIGGGGIDVLAGGMNSDRLYADLEITYQEAQNRQEGLANDVQDFETLNGGLGADLLVGSAGRDALDGGADDDEILAGAGDDLVSELWVGSGNDRIGMGSGRDTALAGDGNDTLDGGSGRDLLFGQKGDDVIHAQLGANENDTASDQHELLDGGDDQDELTGFTGNDFIAGGAGNDTLTGGSGNDNLWGDAQVNTFLLDWTFTRAPTPNWRYDYQTNLAFTSNVASGSDYIDAGAGADWVIAGEGDDYVDGGTDNDVLLGDQGNANSVAGNDTLYGGSGNDEIQGEVGNDYIDGEGDNDTAWGGGGQDTLYGGDGDGADMLHGEAGHDYIDGEGGVDALFGQAGNDTIFGGAGNDQLVGGDDNDQLLGEEDNDTLAGDGGNDTLWGGLGADELQGDLGDDRLFGEDGADELFGEAGSDLLAGGAGNDSLLGDEGIGATASPAGDDTISGEDGNDYAEGNGGNDSIDGGAGNDMLLGGADNDTVAGGANDDTLDGGAGADVLSGGSGSDGLTGGEGNDTLYGGTGVDVMLGGAGDDTYLFDLGDSPVEVGVTEAIVDGDGFNRVVFGSSVSLEGIQVMQEPSGVYLVIDYSPTDRVVVAGGASGAVAAYAFADGTVMSHAGLIGHFSLAPVTGVDGSGNGYQYGGTQSDTMASADGHTVFSGGRGNDTLTGSGGNNTYLFGLGDGADRIVDTSAKFDAFGQLMLNVLRFEAGITAADLRLGLGSLKISIAGSAGDAIHVEGFNAANALAGSAIDRYQFADGTVLTHAQLLERGFDLDGTTAAERITGTSVDDRIDGGAGNDTLVGGAGSDTYRWGAGAGVDSIDNTDSSVGRLDTLRIVGGLAATDVALVREGNDLLVSLRAGTDRVRVLKHFAGANIDAIVFDDGTTWNVAAIEVNLEPAVLTEGPDAYTGTGSNDLIRGLGGNDTLYGIEGNDTIEGGGGFDLLFGDNGNDRLDGGTGEDSLYGGAGSDVFVFGRNSGRASVFADDFNPTSVDAVELDAGITPEETRIVLYEDDIGINVPVTRGTTTEYRTLTLKNYFTNNGQGAVDEIRFADGTIWRYADIRTRLLAGTPADNTISGMSTDDLIDAGAGNDWVNGFAGNDSIAGGSGNDTLNGWSGNDTLAGGADKDSLIGSLGNDVYRFGRGDGQDTIDEDRSAVYGMDQSLPWGTDVIELGGGVLAANVSLVRERDDLLLVLDGSSTQLRVSNHYRTVSDHIEVIRFADGTEWTTADIEARVIAGTPNAMVGTAGNDVFVVDNVGDTITEVAGQGIDRVESSISWSLGANLENLTLTGVLNSSGSGNALSNVLVGNSNDNLLTGNGGTDTLIGGTGDDQYRIDVDDTVIEAAGEGIDTMIIEASGSLTLASNVENAIAEQNATVLGNALNNSIVVQGSYATIDGGLGADTMVGGGATSTYQIDNPGDVVRGGGVAIASVSWSMGTESAVPRLELALGSAAIEGTGNAFANYLRGNLNSNVLNGLGGDDTLEGYGYSGANTLVGGVGNDTYILSEGDDVVIELPGEGTDTIIDYQQSVDLATLTASIENASIGYANSLGPFSVFGTAQNNVLTANAGNNALDGREGDDTLIGGQGNDTYYVDSIGDVIIDTSGFDTVYSTAAHFVSNVESAVLLGSDAISLSGDASANRLDGSQNAGANVLAGGLGDDTYVVGAGDMVIEEVGGGFDTVLASSALTLIMDIEAGQLTGSENVDLTGNAAANRLTGNGGNNIITGDTGDDTIIGSLGLDVIDAGAGNDLILASIAANTTIVDSGVATDLDTLRFSQPLAVYSYQRSGDDLVFDGAGNRIVVQGFYAVGSTHAIDRFEFSDGAVLLPADFAVRVTTGSEGADSLVGGNGIDQIEGLGGNDTILAGGGNDTIFGGSGDDVLDGGVGIDSMAGGAGDDTYWVDHYDDVIDELSGEGVDTVNVAGSMYALAESSDIENVNLMAGASDAQGNSRSNVLIGNSSRNTLYGYDGDDTLNGGLDGDFMQGGAGSDTYYVDNAQDIAEDVWSATPDVDQVFASVTHTIGAFIEKLTLTGASAISGTGNDIDNILVGNTGANRLTGLAGNDTLDGGAGNDTMVGGLGDDTYYFGTGDMLTEAAGEGIDTVVSSVTMTLAANLENLTLSGTSAINGTGNSLNNVLTGNSAANVLSGGTGNDSYYVGAGDSVTESASAGTDTVFSTVTWTLGSNIEKLTLLGSNAINGTGNTLANTLTGNDANNVLSGGAGADTMYGGLGDDTYMVDNVGDVVIDYDGGEGVDLVVSSVTYALGNSEVDNLTLTGTGGIHATGNWWNNRITGNSGANRLTGGDGDDTLIGGAGADTMIGGQDSDTYVVDSTTDVVTELIDGGWDDTVETHLTYTLGQNVEHLVLTGTSAINGTGNSLSNRLTGNSASNRLSGGDGDDTLDGAAGADSLVGGNGSDWYVIDSSSDLITELANQGWDTVEASFNLVLAQNLEGLVLVGASSINGTGNSSDNSLVGNDAGNVLVGEAGNDYLDGLGGVDTMIGGVGDDTFVVDLAEDVVIESAAQGSDTVQSYGSWALAENFESLVLIGYGEHSGTGNDVNNEVAGNDWANVLAGLGGSDVLYGNGGSDTLVGGEGGDSLFGGAGDDTYFLDGDQDAIFEYSDQGWDVVLTSASYALGENVEAVLLTGGDPTNATGNALNNHLVGNASVNLLIGDAGDDTLDGGAGVDTLIGGLGDDVYVIDALTDVVVEAIGEGRDKIVSGFSLTLGVGFEDLELNGLSAVDGIGNDSDNSLLGNEAGNMLVGGFGNDYLEGRGGIDTLVGGLGDDVYVMDDRLDVFVEFVGEGFDQIRTPWTWGLTDEFEGLELTGWDAVDGYGNALDNWMQGNFEANTLFGDNGNDTLVGGFGDDNLQGGNGDDSIDGGFGDDLLDGGVGNDILRGGGGWNAFSGGTGDDILLLDAYSYGTADGGAGNDQMTATEYSTGGHTFVGGTGNDLLRGGGDFDQYRFARGDGQDVIEDNYWNASSGGYDLLTFFSDVTSEQIWFNHVGNNLEVSVIGTTDKVTIQNWFSGSAHHVEWISASDDKLLLDTKVDALVQAMAAFTPPAPGQTTLPPEYQTALAPVLAANWQ